MGRPSSHENCSFSGKRIHLGPGVYRTYQLGIHDNSLSSLFSFLRGMALQLFQYDQYLGQTTTFYSSVSCLPGLMEQQSIFHKNLLGQLILAMKVEAVDLQIPLPPQGSKVIFYRDMKYSGMARSFDKKGFRLIGSRIFTGKYFFLFIVPTGQSRKSI